MEIINCNLSDLETIFELYNQAIAYQKIKKCAVWPVFNKLDVQNAITEKRQFKIVIKNEIACVFTYTFKDKSIWGDKDKNDAVYIHKIATDSKFKGQNLVGQIIEFSKQYARSNAKFFLRMDTVGENTGLINYYTKFNFNYLGLFQLDHFDDLPTHYHHAAVSLFELPL